MYIYLHFILRTFFRLIPTCQKDFWDRSFMCDCHDKLSPKDEEYKIFIFHSRNSTNEKKCQSI